MWMRWDVCPSTEVIIIGLFSHMAKLDSVLEEHLNNATVSLFASKTMQNKLLDYVYHICVDEIKTNCENTFHRFTTRWNIVSCLFQFVIILWFVSSQQVERYIKYFKVENRTADGLSSVLIDELKHLLLKHMNAAVMRWTSWWSPSSRERKLS